MPGIAQVMCKLGKALLENQMVAQAVASVFFNFGPEFEKPGRLLLGARFIA